ncbi:helix-turn-helix domain-containing protein [Jatrophihabitans sp. YIM 134969]
MVLRLDTAEASPSERVDLVHDAIAASIVHVDIAFPERGGPDAVSVRGAIGQLGPLTVCSIHSTAVRVTRTASLARDDLEPSLFFGLQLEGSSMVVQGDRQVVVGPGDLVFYESTTPYTLLDERGVRQHFFRVPLAELDVSRDLIRSLAATRLAPGSPVATLAVDWFRSLGSQPDLLTAADADRLGRPSVEVFRSVLATHADRTSMAAEAAEGSLELRILAVARRHLDDPALTAARVAADLHISERQLYKTLAARGVSLAGYVRAERLEAARRDLLRHPTTTIAAIARRRGFGDPSAFARAFRRAHAVTPHEWRRQHLPERPLSGDADGPPSLSP